MHTFSDEARERPYRALQAAKLVHDQAESIHGAAFEATDEEVVLAVVSSDLRFEGIWIIEREETLTEVPLAEDSGGWCFIFAPGISLAQIEEQCARFMRIAFKRWDVMQRWMSRQR